MYKEKTTMMYARGYYTEIYNAPFKIKNYLLIQYSIQ